MSAPQTELTLSELDTLDQMLAQPEVEETSMDAAALEGFCAALALGPRPVPFERWLPYVWDMEHALARPRFAGSQQGEVAHDLITRAYASVAARLRAAPGAFVPLFRRGDQWGVAEWCAGFLLGTSIDARGWQALIESEPDWLQPVVVLAMGDDDELEATFEDVEDAMDAVGAALVKLVEVRWQ